MNLSIIIPVKNDVRIEQCLKSIDEDVEVVIVLNDPSQEVEELVSKLKTPKVLRIKEANLSKAYNHGILNAKYENILLMDSDCVFEKDCINKLHEGLKVAQLAKGKVIFKRNNWLSDVIARIREFTTSDFCNAYSPPLAFNKSIVDNIDGYYFDSDFKWEEDFEFNIRVQKSKLKINWITEAKIYHPELSLYRDLKSAFYYGTGHYIGISKGLYTSAISPNLKLRIKRIQRQYLLEKKGIAAFYYYKIWCMSYKLGIVTQKYLKKYCER